MQKVYKQECEKIFIENFDDEYKRHLDFAIKNELYTLTKWKKYIILNNIKNFYLKVNKKWKNFFLELRKNKFKLIESKEEYLIIAIKNKLTCSDKWEKYRKEHNLKYCYYCYRKLNKKWPDFFHVVRDQLSHKKTYNEHIDLAIENKLTNIDKWVKYIHKYHLLKLYYIKLPIKWGDFFSKIRNKKETYKNHLKLAIKNELINERKWTKYRKIYNCNNYYGCYYINKMWPNFFKIIKTKINKKETHKNHLKLAIDNELTCGHKWSKYLKVNNKEKKYYSVHFLKKNIPNFFDIVRKNLKKKHIKII